ncbi:MAG: DNA polymerase III subunit gamma/tau [Chlorobi bacterium]|nr:DNA polymerase III subunit gamma/tau [Chlorobiota bacterium]
MEYIVSARKYRPATFQSVVGQSSITTTLKNAIKNNQLAHAYLFCGPRGVGKTTCARIFAKTINCSNVTDDFDACDECESCKAFNENRSYNIHELDAASNNSVEDIRTLTDKVRVPPQMGKYSVYIIDEVHMLSQSAFNAFLKTLEEPPKHAIFILATTEKHKILPTILSRCQIFDFNRISIEDAVGHLKYVAENEGVTIEEDALNVIAQKADGAMRDALSIFDQVVAFSGKNITYKQVIENLNVLDYDYYFKITDALLAGEHKQALLIFDEILRKGFDAQHFISGLAAHFRDLLVSKDQATIKLMEVGASVKQKYADQSLGCSVDFLYDALDIATECDFQYRLAKNKRLHVEFALIKMSRILLKKKLNESGSGSKNNITEATTQNTTRQKTSIPPKKSEPLKKVKPTTSLNSLINEEQPNTGKGTNIEKEKSGSENENEVTGKNNNVDPDMLVSAWDKYLAVKKNDARLYSILSSKKPSIKEKSALEIEVTFTQKKIIEDLKNEMITFLRKELGNDGVTLDIKDAVVKTEGKDLFTDEDKLKWMIKENPALAEMKKRFGLELE